MKCSGCNTEFEAQRKKKFCSDKCRARFNSKIRYYKIRKTKKYKASKAKRKKNFKNWLAKNREHFNDLMRNTSREWQRKRRAEAISKGLCTECNKVRVGKQGVACDKCRERKRKFYYNRKLKGGKNGIKKDTSRNNHLR